jgi:IclR family transcriptional regulator, mhp operon transcriptional activator
MTKTESGIRTNRSLVRGLTVLTEISAHGPMRASEVARRVKLPRATVVRLIETLIEAGMIRRHDGSKTYEVTEQVTRLSHGYDRWSAMTDSAVTAINEAAQSLTWPLVLTTPSGLDMVVRYNTDHSSPLALQRYNLGFRIPIFDTASGMVFLAYGSDQERETYLRLLETEEGTLDVTRVKRRIEETRLDGYCIHHRAGSLEKALAVPIIRNDAFQSALTMRYIPSAVSYTELKNRYVAPLLELAKVIAAKLSVS